MIMNGVKHYFKYSKNEYTNNYKKLFICEVTIYIYEMERQERLKRLERYQRLKRLERYQRSKRPERVERSGTFAQTAKLKFWQTFRGKPFLFKLGS